MTEEKILTRGRFVWHDLMTRDVAKAREFYVALAGWSVNEIDMGENGTYPMFMNGESGVGGAVDLGDAPAELPSHWINYISVIDVDAACEQAPGLGGKVCHAPFDIPGVGRTAIIEDPGGAIFHAFTSSTMGAEKAQPEPGDFCWYDCLNSDLEASRAFYSALFGWTFKAPPFESEKEMWVAHREDGRPCASLMAKPDPVPRSIWLNHLLVDDLATATARALELGAKKHMGPIAMPGIGSFSAIADSTGAHLMLFEGASELASDS